MKLAIVGAGGHGAVVADIAEQCGWSNIFFFDDMYPEISMLGSWPIKGNISKLLDTIDAYDSVFVAIGDNRLRSSIIAQIEARGALLISLIHPSAVVSSYAEVGAGTVIMPSVSINAFAAIGKGCIVNTSAVVEHNCELQDYVHLSPKVALAGGVIVGSYSWIGIGATIIQNINIGHNVVVGAGALVIKNVVQSIVVGGVPARELANNK